MKKVAMPPRASWSGEEPRSEILKKRSLARTPRAASAAIRPFFGGLGAGVRTADAGAPAVMKAFLGDCGAGGDGRRFGCSSRGRPAVAGIPWGKLQLLVRRSQGAR
ncbi:hypothetical protein GCM10023205_41380 [Yinghuangia aomiensis]|uniref:Uncharacterized protein n=1 Tax=Yinghuangia aomiensis TaxID=676205 RepID=A0ABP9HHV8_9ACTN